MTGKQIFGLLILAAGIVLMFFGIQAMYEMSQGQGVGKDVDNFFSHNPMWNPIIEFFGGAPQTEPDDYSWAFLTALIAGVVLGIVGSVMAVTFRKRS